MLDAPFSPVIVAHRILDGLPVYGLSSSEKEQVAQVLIERYDGLDDKTPFLCKAPSICRALFDEPPPPQVALQFLTRPFLWAGSSQQLFTALASLKNLNAPYSSFFDLYTKGDGMRYLPLFQTVLKDNTLPEHAFLVACLELLHVARSGYPREQLHAFALKLDASPAAEAYCLLRQGKLDDYKRPFFSPYPNMLQDYLSIAESI